MRRIHWLAITLMVTLLLLGACSSDDETETVPASPEATPVETSVLPEELSLSVIEPKDEAVVDSSRLTVAGTTLPDAVLSVNGKISGLDAEGDFSVEVNLEPGPNNIEVIASDFYGNERAVMLTVIYASDLPLTVLEPDNEAVVNTPAITISGITIPDAVISIDDSIINPDPTGDFSHVVELEAGPNYIEVIASDFEGHSVSVPVTVVYSP